MTVKEFQEQIKAGIPDVLPAPKPYDPTINHAPKRKEILTEEERVLAIRNALRYFPAKHHEVLAREFAEELHKYGRIYMYRFRPDYEMYARPIEEYPHKSRQAAARSAVLGACLNVKINAAGLKDRAVADDLIGQANRIVADAEKAEREILEIVESKIK